MSNDAVTLLSLFESIRVETGGRPLATDIGAALATLLERGRRAWPDLELPSAAYLRHLARHLPAAPTPADIDALNAEEMYLACACAVGQAAAAALFETRYLAPAAAELTRVLNDADAGADLRGELRDKLLPAPAGVQNKIAHYAGRGPLEAWLRVAALRMVLDARAKEKSRVPVADMIAMQDLDPVRDLTRLRFEALVRNTIADAFAALPPRERNVLRLYYVDSAGQDDIARIYRVDRSTVSRWLETARTSVRQAAQHQLQSELRLSPSDADSLLDALLSRLDLSLSCLE